MPYYESLSALAYYLQGQVRDGALDLDQAALDDTAAPLFNALNSGYLRLYNPQILLTDNGLEISGRAALLDLPETTVELTVSQQPGGYQYALSTLAEAVTFHAVPWFTLEGAAITVAVDPSAGHASGQVRGTFVVSGVSIPLSAALPLPDGTWQIGAIFEPEERLSLNVIASASPDLANLLSALPPEIRDGLGDLGIEQLIIRPGSSPALALTVTSPAGWPIVPGQFGVSDLRLAVDLALGAEKRLTFSTAGALDIGGVTLPLSVTPGEDGSWTFQLEGGPVTLPGLSSLLASVGGDGSISALSPGFLTLGEIQLARLAAVFNPSLRTLDAVSFAFGSESALHLPQMQAAGLRDLLVDFMLTAPLDTANRSLTGVFAGTLALGSAAIPLMARRDSPDDPWSFGLQEGQVATLPGVADIAALIGDPRLIDDFPPGLDAIGSVVISELQLQVDPVSGALTYAAFALTSAQPWVVVPDQFVIESLSLAFAVTQPHDRTQRVLNAQVDGAFALALAEGFSLENVTLGFEVAPGGEWRAGGGLSATLFDRPFDLEASIERSVAGSTYRFGWQSAQPIELLDIEGTAELTLSSVLLSITRPTGRAATGSAWQLEAISSLSIANAFSASGQLRLASARGRTAIAFVSSDPAATALMIRLPLTAGGAADRLGFGVQLQQIEFAHSAQAGWSLEADTTLVFNGLPPSVDAVLPDAVPITFRAASDGVSLIAENLVTDAAFPFPVMNLADAETDLGTAHFSVTRFTLRIEQSASLTARLRLMLPEAINNLFGTRDGKPASNLINRQVDFEIGIDTRAGFQARLLSPIIGGELREQDGVTRVYMDFGEFGAIQYAPPTFSYDGANFATSGEFEVVRPLRLPLTPVKAVLDAMGGDFLTDIMPDSVPLKTISVLQDDRLEVDGLLSLLATTAAEIGFDFPIDEVRPVLETLETQFNRLPADFREYLSIDIPDYLRFAVEITPTSGFGLRLDIATRDDEPIKLLFPAAIPPALIGLKIYRIAIGQMLSGSLIITDTHIVIDRFDIFTLAAVLALPADMPMLPDSEKLHTRVTIRNLFMPIVYQTIIPIPVPLFYDDLGIEYLGLEGLAFGMKWQFPMPQGGITNLIPLFMDMGPFFTDKDYLLPRDIFDRHQFGLTFSIEPGFIQLPEYLGGGQLGQRGQLYEVSLTELLVRMLNALKRPSIADLLPIVPLEYRVGGIDAEFGPMRFRTAWAATTAEEFVDVLAAPIGLQSEFVEQLREIPQNQRSELMELAAVGLSKPNTEAEGALIFLLGDWEIGGLVDLDVRFGMAQSPSLGFGLGFYFQGRFGSFLDFYARGIAVFGKVGAQEPSRLTQGTPAQTQQLEQEVAALQAQIAQATAALSQTNAQIASLQARLVQETARLFEINREIAALRAQLNRFPRLPMGFPMPERDRLERQIRQRETDRLALETQVAALRGQFDAQQRTLQTLQPSVNMMQTALVNAQTRLAEARRPILVVEQPGDHLFRIEGSTQLKILSHTVFYGDILLNDRRFELNGNLTLFPPGSPLQVNGRGRMLVNEDGTIYFNTSVAVALKDFTLLGAEVEITNNSVSLRGRFLAVDVAFDALVEQNRFLLAGDVRVGIDLNFDVGPLYDPITGLRVVDRLHIDTSLNAFLAVQLGSAVGFYAAASGSFTWRDYTLQSPSFALQASPADIKALGDHFVSEIQRVASDLFAQFFRNMGEWIRAGLNGLVTLVASLQPAVRAAGRWVNEAWAATANWSKDAWSAAYQWGDQGWGATVDWTGTAWDATTRWSSDAWRATSAWGADAWNATRTWSNAAWNATTAWGPSAWNATTQWSSDAWNATTRWGDDAWRATETWGADTWNASTRWSREVWGDTVNWTRDQFNNALRSVDDFLRRVMPHGDVSFVPHIDTPIIPHIDISPRLHGDVALVPHADFNAIPHADVGFQVHGDTAIVPHGDVGFSVHGDIPSALHTDTPGILHADFGWGRLHADTPRALHGDVRGTPHLDTPGRAHIDTPQTAHIDTPGRAHIDTPGTAHIDTPQTAHIDTPSILHGDTPAVGHGDIPQTAHIDTP
jgi:hypothetical protein